MIYLAESGSTKCDAVFLNDDGSEHCRITTMGFNPFFHDAEFIAREIVRVPQVSKHGAEVSKVYFFGAGCSTPALNQKVADGLQAGFPNATIEVDHDLRASAYATYKGHPSITCILGTGSNCVYFDGSEIKRKVSGLGYILGDEGSASYIGKKVVAAYLYKTMPAEAREDFDRMFNLTKEEIDKRVYFSDHVNVFLGSFAPFAHKHLRLPFFYDLVYKAFREFMEIQVMAFDEAGDVPINFVGSVAHHFSTVLEDVLNDLGLQMGVIIQKPLDGLIRNFIPRVINIPNP